MKDNENLVGPSDLPYIEGIILGLKSTSYSIHQT